MIAIIDYGAGNIASVFNAIKSLNVEIELTNDSKKILEAEKIILPGVGEASFAMKKLKELNLIDTIRNVRQPFLGICLGSQLLCSFSEEGNVECLGIIDANVLKFNDENSVVPHMGWNSIKIKKDDKLFKDIQDKDEFYFAHSYYIPIIKETLSETSNIVNFSSSIKKDNFYGVQFHPEKSSKKGLLILKNFLEI